MAHCLLLFLALSVMFVGTRSWRILAFALHQMYSSGPGQPQDAIYHQRQAILRNAETGLSATLGLGQVVWCWTGHGSRLRRRLIPDVCSISILTAMFAMASLFSSRLASLSGTDVLIASDNCGTPATPSYLTTEKNATGIEATRNVTTLYIPFTGALHGQALSYARSCYAERSGMLDCGLLPKRRLSYKVDRNATCPFDSSICTSFYGNFELDTGYIDSAADLGVNAPPEERIQARYRIRCAPLVIDGYTSQEVVGEEHRQTIVTTSMYYGSSNSFQAHTAATSNATFSHAVYFAGPNVTAVFGTDQYTLQFVCPIYASCYD